MKRYSNILEIRLPDGNKVDWETLPVEKKIEYSTQLNRQAMLGAGFQEEKSNQAV